jgi:N-acetylmuramoyl-L-alanine amidase
MNTEKAWIWYNTASLLASFEQRMMLSERVSFMRRNPVCDWVTGDGSLSRLPGWVAAIGLSIVGTVDVAYGNVMLPDPMMSPTVAEIVPIPQLDRPILRLGSQGEEVLELQAILKLLGYYSGAVNGVYDGLTAEAVSRFQQAADLNPDGIVGTDTWNQLLPPGPKPIAVAPSTPCICDIGSTVPATAPGDLPILQYGMRGTAVVALQRRLQTQGFFSGIVDGIFGSETEEAVRAAQLSYNLNVNGIVDSSFWGVLLR